MVENPSEGARQNIEAAEAESTKEEEVPTSGSPYAASVPEPQRLAPNILRSWLGSVWYLAWHAIRPYGNAPKAPSREPPTQVASEGKLDPESVEICKGIYDVADRRIDGIEKKASDSFSLITFLATLNASALAYGTSRTFETAGAKTAFYGCAVLGLIFVVVAFIAAMRAVAIRNQKTLFAESVLDPVADRFRKYDPVRHACGLLHCAAWNHALADHAADFVRAGRMFILAVPFLLLAAGVVLLNASTGKSSKTDALLLECQAALAEEREELDLQILLAAEEEHESRVFTETLEKQVKNLDEAVKALDERVQGLERRTNPRSKSERKLRR